MQFASFLLASRFALTLVTVIDVPGITVLRDGHHVSRTSDFIMYSVEAEFIDTVVAKFGPCTSLIHPHLFHLLMLFGASSDKGRSDRSGPNIRQSPRAKSIRKIPSSGRLYRLLSFPPRAYRITPWPASRTSPSITPTPIYSNL